jgi:hypothetical protein
MADRDVEIAVERAAVRLGVDYARMVDGRDAVGWSELFTPDGCLDLGDRQIVGRDALREFAAASPPGVHIPGPIAVMSYHQTITCESPFVYVSSRSGTVLAGYYRDELAWQDDRLVFVVRRIDRRASSPVAR